jgi:hypothetical protein
MLNRTTKRRFGVRVIRDIRNSNRDYWISAKRALELYEEGKLIRIEAYSNGYEDKWCYATREINEYFD